MTATADLPRDAPAPANEPAFLARVRLRARRRVRWLRSVWGVGAAGPELAVSHDEVDRILVDRGADERAERAFDDADAAGRALTAAIRDADRAAAGDDLLARVRRELALTDAEVDLLAMTVAVEADPALRRVFGYLHDDATATAPTPWLAGQLFRWPASTRISADSPLIRWRLARPADGTASPWSVTTPWIVDPQVASCLRHGLSIDPRLSEATRLVPPRASAPTPCLYPDERDALASYVRAMSRGDRPVELVIVGPAGTGKRTLASQVADELGIALLIADAGRLLGPAVDPAAAAEAMVLVTRTARLARAAVYWHDADAAQPGAWRDALRRAGISFAATTTQPAVTHGADDDIARTSVRLPILTRAVRSSLWRARSELAVPEPVLDWPLSPAEIARAAAAAPAGPAAIAEACRSTLRIEGATLASPLPRPYVWDDLVLAPAIRAHLDELEAQVRLRWPVYEEWGFGRLCPMGKGIAALFAGPSGTGKTMAAQVLARSLGMEIYRIDLAGVMSKYIGETEKNLRQVFDACERANIVLFFDEADALFGQRTQVKDAHDRFANIEIDYLLQRMEQFDGLAVLATNRRGDLDSAFMRRLRVIVDFTPPAVAERRTLWALALPDRAPDGTPLLDAIDFERLAQRLEMTGADIKAAALAAAFLARTAGTRIGMAHVIHAARRQLAKRGVVVRSGDLEG